ncbi:DASH family cryptochrome [Pseudoalteromonas viridis]|uniref:Cryptochrome DASH n=1 Tax=Pseudoalteromonas viridis TaxID=339617 RepID=A0ABX7V2L8_9GAMM|nr:DASH family cryptochrome [Pseudoalteromonas viridis]QTL34725.1 DASH family cryptochrome [Pseudoalteromonas viridis]
MKKTLYWFTQDLRLDDNLALDFAAHNSDALTFVYVINPKYRTQTNHHCTLLGDRQAAFIADSLMTLDSQLSACGHKLLVLEGEPNHLLPELVAKYQINQVICAEPVGFYERAILQQTRRALGAVPVHSFWQHTLFDQAQIQTLNSDLGSFTQFRKRVEKAPLSVVTACRFDSNKMPAPLVIDSSACVALEQWQAQLQSNLSETRVPLDFPAGEEAAQAHLKDYFESGVARRYKETRNELDGWLNSTKMSPYLALGNLSPRQIWWATDAFERQVEANESTYWIKFELLWREYFQWLSLKLGAKLYRFQGLAQSKPLTTFMPERFVRWCEGNTPAPLVNALMNQLNETGYMSNRGRQIVASYFVHELGLDWRYGAAYFQQQLLDFDVASNWGNWQYIAGVGVDPRGGRHFNIEKQAQLYDPQSVFVAKWRGKQCITAVDSVDAADWPMPAEADV